MRYLRYFFIIAISILGLLACEEEDECIGCDTGPKLKLSFKATQTLEITQEKYDATNLIIEEKIAALEEDNLSDSEKQAIEEELETLREDSTLWGDWLSLFNSSSVHLDRLEGLGSHFIAPYEDTVAEGFAIPIDMNSDTSTYIFSYHNLIDTLKIYYERDIILGVDGVRMRVYNFSYDTLISSFDSLKFSCKNCSNGKNILYLYF